MNREEILKRSREENIYGDERDKTIRVRRDAFSVWGMLVLGIVIMIVKLCRTQSPADIISLMFCTSATASLYEAIQTRKRLHIIATAILYALALYYFYRFCAGLF